MAKKKKSRWNLPVLKLKTPKERMWVVLGAFFVLVLALYGQSLFNGFVHDDIGQIVRNDYVQSVQYLSKVVTGCIWEFQLGDCITYYRPVQSFTYLVLYQITSAAWLFHLANLLAFAGVGWMLFLLVRKLTGDFSLAALTGFLFLLHPAHNEAVSWISALPELAFGLFALASAYFYVVWRQGKRKVSKRRARKKVLNIQVLLRMVLGKKPVLRMPNRQELLALAKTYWKLELSVLLYFLAMLSKEPAVLLPLLFLAYDLMLAKGKWRELLVPPIVARYAAFAAVFLLYMAMRVSVLGSLGQSIDYHGSFSVAERLYAFVTLFGQYIGKFLLPYPLLFFYPFEKQVNFLSAPFLLSLLALGAFAAAFGYGIWKRKTRFVFPLLWFGVFLLPVLIAVDRLGENVFSERYLFVPSMGLVFFVALGITLLLRAKKVWYRRAALGLIALFVVGAGAVIIPRHSVWKDDFVLYTATIEQNPNAHAIRRNLAVELTEEGNTKEAIAHLQEIIQKAPNWRDIDKAYNNLGDAYQKQGDIEKAREAYQKMADISGGFSYKAYNNLGGLLFDEEKYLESLLHMCKAVQLAPDAREVQANINRLVSVFQTVQGENLKLLRDDIVEGGAFEQNIVGIQGSGRECSEQECALSFEARLQNGELLFPVLILAIAQDGSVFRPTGTSFDQQTGTIQLTAGPEYNQGTIQFIFPSCRGVYYEAEVEAN